MTQHDHIAAYLKNCKQLSLFCSQNGWIIDDSIYYEILQQQPDKMLIYVTFLESIMEGSGCQCDQKPCYGRLLLELNEDGEITGVSIP